MKTGPFRADRQHGSAPTSMRTSGYTYACVWALVLVALPLLIGAQRKPEAGTSLLPPATRGQPFHRGYPTTPDVTMRVYVPVGRVRVVPWARDSVDVSGTLGANASVFGGGSRTHLKLGVESLVAADSTMPRADLVVRIPRAARVWIKTIDGDIDVRGTTGEVEAYAVRGRIAIREVRGVTVIESIDAPVHVEYAEGDLRVRGGKGDVSLANVRGTVSVATISGAVTLTAFTADGRIETIGGTVTFGSGVLNGVQLDIQTHSGGIAIAVPATRSPVLELSSRAGATALPTLRQSSANGRITARSFKGRITVTAR